MVCSEFTLGMEIVDYREAARTSPDHVKAEEAARKSG
jgi:hypothetical protein